MSVTALIHTKNSGKTLAACLQSLAWCDERWVIDMESSDNTLTIAKKYATKIYAVKANLPYADPIRDQFLQKVKTDWALIVDSDEEVSATLATRLQEAMLTQSVDAYEIPRLNMIFGQEIYHTGFWPDYIIRLIRKGKGTYPPTVHAQPIISGTVAQLPADPEGALIHHHYESIEVFLSRLNAYTSLEVEKLLQVQPTYTPFDAMRAFFDQFNTRFFAQQGYKDGATGFTLSLLMGIYSMVAVLKAWEKTKGTEKIDLEEVEAEVADACRKTSYWVANEELGMKKNVVSKVNLRLRRKLNS